MIFMPDLILPEHGFYSEQMPSKFAQREILC